MNGWGWALLGYGVAAVVLVTYLWYLNVRTHAAERRLEGLD